MKMGRISIVAIGVLGTTLWLHAQTPVEVTLIDELDETRAGYCLDTRGSQNEDSVLGLQSHSCRSYLGAFDEDQAFDAELVAEGVFQIVELGVCMTARDAIAGSELTFEPCIGSGAQRFEHNADGRIIPSGAPEICVTVGSGPSRSAMGGNPPHQIRGVTLESCDTGLQSRQRWRLRESPE